MYAEFSLIFLFDDNLKRLRQCINATYYVNYTSVNNAVHNSESYLTSQMTLMFILWSDSDPFEPVLIDKLPTTNNGSSSANMWNSTKEDSKYVISIQSLF